MHYIPVVQYVKSLVALIAKDMQDLLHACILCVSLAGQSHTRFHEMYNR